MQHICLGVVTRQRPEGVIRLMRSFSSLRVPDNVSCTVLIVENESVSTLTKRRSEIEDILPFPVQIVLEKDIGIPSARNRALDIALAGGFDFLTFVDDDQIVDEYWLLMLYTSAKLRNLDLVGGPRGMTPDEDSRLSWMNRLVFEAFRKRTSGFDSKRFLAAFSDEEYEVRVHTNNWMVRLCTLRSLGIRFDVAFRQAGGSDTDFWRRFRDSGGRTGWASDARTGEIWSERRLTLRYYYIRVREEYLSNLIQENMQPNARELLLRLPTVGFRLVMHLLRLPFTNGRSIISAIAVAARTHAEILAMRGRQSTRYKYDH